ncbi:MAG: hypothetical protein U0746_18975 [Gemmataceae bacterium]
MGAATMDRVVTDALIENSGDLWNAMRDLVVDTWAQRLTGNPAHGGEHVLELY